MDFIDWNNEGNNIFSNYDFNANPENCNKNNIKNVKKLY